MTDSQLSKTEKINLSNYRMDISYDGQNYYGWQRHKEKPTIQGALENAVTNCYGLRTNVEGSGRTDRGTHAIEQVATIRLPDDIDEKNAVTTLNNELDQTIKILNIKKMPDEFHARESAIGKRYRYKIWNHPELPPEMDGKVWYIPSGLNVKSMKKASPFFVGKMDYASFAKVPNYQRATTVKTVYSLELNQEGPLLDFSIIADGFLYKMVRNIVRALVKVGEGRTKHSEISRIIEAKNRKAAPGTAPASGLYLDTVFYEVNSMNKAIKKNHEKVDF